MTQDKLPHFEENGCEDCGFKDCICDTWGHEKTTNYKNCSKHGENGEPTCNECWKNLSDFITKKNGLFISQDGDMIN